jgi:glycosyltransferase involved in cell wall biosynthesis
VSPDLSIILFAVNEEENIAPVLEELLAWTAAHAPGAEIVFVDDGSADGTAQVAADVLGEGLHRVVRHETNRGIGAALKTGVLNCQGEWVTFLPADGQVPPEAVGVLRAEAKDTGADVVFSVYEDRDDGAYRKLMSWGVRALIHVVHGVRLHSEGPYLFRRAVFRPEELPPDTFFLNFEFPIRALRAGLKTSRVTVECRRRFSGVSKSAGAKRVLQVGRDLIAMRLRRHDDDWARVSER